MNFRIVLICPDRTSHKIAFYILSCYKINIKKHNVSEYLLYCLFPSSATLCSYSNYVYGLFLGNKSVHDFCSIEFHPHLHHMAVQYSFDHISNHRLGLSFYQHQIQPWKIEEHNKDKIQIK